MRRLDGFVVKTSLSEGQAYDGNCAQLMLATLSVGTILLADLAYDADTFEAEIAARGGFANIPSLPHRMRKFAFSSFILVFASDSGDNRGEPKTPQQPKPLLNRRLDNALSSGYVAPFPNSADEYPCSTLG